MIWFAGVKSTRMWEIKVSLQDKVLSSIFHVLFHGNTWYNFFFNQNLKQRELCCQVAKVFLLLLQTVSKT